MNTIAEHAPPAADAAELPSEIAGAMRVLSALPAPCAVYDGRNGELRFANDAFAGAFGKGASIAQRHVFESRFQRYATRAQEPTAQRTAAAADQQLRQYDAFEPASKNWFAVQWTDFDWLDGQRHDLVMVTNTSARQAAVSNQVDERDKLLFTSRMMSVGEMASTIAHELNQPLAAIINYLTVGDRLMASPDNLSDAREAVAMAQTQAEHASAVIRHLREFVQAREPQRHAHRIDELVDRVLQLTELDIRQSLVQLSHRCADDLPDVLVDDVMIEQVLLNLIRNAIGAMREVHPMHRRVRIVAHLNLDDDVEVRVTDSGCGVDAEQETRLFEPLYTTKPDGLGIGLAICRSILEYHNGRLWFERDDDGQTVFAMTLPTALSQEDYMSEQTVVLVDDNDAFRKSTTWLLKTAGFTVDEFDNAASALHALKHSRRSGGTCLLSDVRMPEMNGLQLHEEVKKAAIDVPVVFMTGHGDIPLAVDAMRNGAVDFVEKPFSEQRIVSAVRGAFKSHTAQHEEHPEARSRIESLTPRERQVLDLVVAGKSNKVIAGLLDISIKTVELHRANMMGKMKVRTVPDLMKLVLGHHIS